MYELNQNNPDSLVNHPAPHLEEWVTKELTSIGGVNSFGQPNIRVVWGMSELRFACGRLRMKYPTNFYTEEADYQFRLRNLTTNELKFCSLGEFIEAKKIYDSIDPAIEWLPEYKVSRSIEWIGTPRWMVEEYVPVVAIKDSPSNWEAHRYGWWFDPEKQKQVWTDLIGPFPYEGRYEHLLTVKEDDGRTYLGKYSPFTSREGLLIREALQKREVHKAKSVEEAVRDFQSAQIARQTKSEFEIADELKDTLKQHRRALPDLFDNA